MTKIKIMKTLTLTITALVLSTGLFAQEKERKIEKQEVRSIKKEVRMEEENGQKTLTIITSENGQETKEVYQGDAADKKLEELMTEHDVENDAEVNKEVKVEEIDGLKRVTVITKEGGTETVEVFEGPDADKKLMELESEGSAPKVRKEKRIKNEPVIREKSNM